jgi:hypothetical protein
MLQFGKTGGESPLAIDWNLEMTRIKNSGRKKKVA